jgi:hypothetical protein
MLVGVLSLFDDPIADLVTVGILVSIFLHHREMRVLQKRMDELSFQASDLKILVATIPSVGDGPSLAANASLRPVLAPSPSPERSRDPTFPA